MKRTIWDWHNRATGATPVALALLFLVEVFIGQPSCPRAQTDP
jgi:hypothetical protein